MADAYPLDWPPGWPRTSTPERARFGVTLARARDGIIAELSRMGVPDWRVVISTNVTLRRDGLPYANQPEPEDVGVAVYWSTPQDESRVIACDRWDRVRDNLRAVEKTLDAMRGIDRWGSSDIVERAFTGFEALPSAGHEWRAVLGFDDGFGRGPGASPADTVWEYVKCRYRELAAGAHPDVGGDPSAMVRLNQARDAAKAELLATQGGSDDAA